MSECLLPLLRSRQAPAFRQLWRVAGVYPRTINLAANDGALLTLHRAGEGVSPMGWVLRHDDHQRLRLAIKRDTPISVTEKGLNLAGYHLVAPQRECSLRLPDNPAVPCLQTSLLYCNAETGLYGPLSTIASQPLPVELRQFQRSFRASLAGKVVNWCRMLGKGPGLTPTHDDILVGMLLAGWYHRRLSAECGARFFDASVDLRATTTQVSVNYLRFAAQGVFSSPLLHFAHSLTSPARLPFATRQLLSLGHTSGADTLLGFWLGQRVVL